MEASGSGSPRYVANPGEWPIVSGAPSAFSISPESSAILPSSNRNNQRRNGKGGTIAAYSQEKLDFIEELGLALGALGMPRMAGRILGALLMADPPELSAEDLADTLQASRGSISTMTRMLESFGIVERVSRPGDRKAYYRNRPGAWAEALRREAEAMNSLRRLAERGLELVEGSDPEVRVGIEEMHDVFCFWEQEIPRVLEDWRRQHEAKRRSGPA